MKLWGDAANATLSISSYNPIISFGIFKLLSMNFGMRGSKYQAMLVSFLKNATPFVKNNIFICIT